MILAINHKKPAKNLKKKSIITNTKLLLDKFSSQRSSDSDDISLNNSNKIQGIKEDQEKELSEASSFTLAFGSENEEIDAKPQSTTKLLQFDSNIVKKSLSKIKEKKVLKDFVKIENKNEIQNFLKEVKSIKRSKKQEKYKRKPEENHEKKELIQKNFELKETETKNNLFAMLFQGEKKVNLKEKLAKNKEKSKKNKENLLFQENFAIKEEAMTKNLEISEIFSPKKINKKKKKKIEIFLDGQAETEFLENDKEDQQNEENNDEISLNETPPQVPKKRRKRSKKEIELYKILQNAMNMAKKQENLTEKVEIPSPSEKRKKRRRTKKEMEEYRIKKAQIKAQILTELQKEHLLKESESESDLSLDYEFHNFQIKNNSNNELNNINEINKSSNTDIKNKTNNETQNTANNEIKNEFMKMINHEQSFALNMKKQRKKRRSKIEMKQMREEENLVGNVYRNNPEFEIFLNVDSQTANKNKKIVKSSVKKYVSRRKIFQKQEEVSEYKSQDPFDLKNKEEDFPEFKSQEEIPEKIKKTPTSKEKRGFTYYPLQKWDRIDLKNPEETNNSKEKLSSQIKDFDGTPGIKLSLLNYTSNPYDFFSQYLPDFIFEEIARFTNISAYLAKEKAKNWVDCTAQEIRDLFALFFLFELIKKNNVADYWTEDPLLRIKSVQQIMSEERFFLFKKFLCFYDKNNKNDKENGIFYKCQFLVNHILESCSNIYTPDKNICLQEVLLNYAGITKTDSWGPRKQRGKNEINIAVLKEANSGYIWNILLNEGNKLFERKQLFQLLNGLEYKGYRLFMDCVFTSNNFITELKSKHFAACGLMSYAKLKLPAETRKEFESIDKQGDCGFFKNKELMITVWNHSTRKVYSISNYHDYEMVSIKKSRKIGYLSKIEYKIYEYESPRVIYDIVENLKGNDYMNRSMNYFSIDYNSWKWYYRVMLYFLEVCMMNSYLIYEKTLKQKNLSPISNLEYRKEIIKNLCKWNEKTHFLPSNPEGFKENCDEINVGNEENEKKEIIFDDVVVNCNCKLVYIGPGFCHYCRHKRHKLKKTLFWCKECQYGLCVNCYEQHKIDQIIKRIKGLESVYNKNLIDLLITKQCLIATETLTDISSHAFMKRFRRTKRQLKKIKRNETNNIENKEETKEENEKNKEEKENNIEENLNPLKRKRRQ